MNKKTNSRASFTTKAYLGEEKKQTYMYVHTSYISENNMSKISSLAISIFDIIISSAIGFFFQALHDLQRYQLTGPA